MYLENQSVCPLIQIGTPPPTKSECVPTPREPKEGICTHSPAGEGVGGPISDDWRKKPSTLSTLCFIEKLTYVQSGPDQAAG